MYIARIMYIVHINIIGWYKHHSPDNKSCVYIVLYVFTRIENCLFDYCIHTSMNQLVVLK